jgi:hypothetical protein
VAASPFGWLHRVEEIDGALCMGRGLEDRASIVFQNRYPVGDIRCMVFTNDGCEFKVTT